MCTYYEVDDVLRSLVCTPPARPIRVRLAATATMPVICLKRKPDALSHSRPICQSTSYQIPQHATISAAEAKTIWKLT